MLLISRLLIIASFLGGAFLASLDPRTIQWEFFLPVIVGGVIGVVLVKRAEVVEAKSSEKLYANRTLLITSLQNIVQNLRDLNSKKTEIPTYEMRFDIDRLFREDLRNFADARDSMKHLFGLQAYADIMSSFAAGERYINRVWSASTDGYVDEVLMYVEKSLSQFEHALEEYEKHLGEREEAYSV